jgi:hypothetical protein
VANENVNVIQSEIQITQSHEHVFMILTFVAIFLVAVIGYVGIFRSWQKANEPIPIVVELPAGLDRNELATIIGNTLAWDTHTAQVFAATHAQMQWASLNQYIVDIFTEEYRWESDEQITFATQSTRYLNPEYDFLATAYVPGTYFLDGISEPPRVAELLINRLYETAGENVQTFLKNLLVPEAMAKTADFVRAENELLPDLVSLPAQDLTIEEKNEKIFLRFSTTYYNMGRGPLELRADEETAGIKEDIERNVFQRIYEIDGEYRDKHAGAFLWHEEHLHYHFGGFITYTLEGVQTKESFDFDQITTKSTFCVRDVSQVDLELKFRANEARYLICGKEMQGISVGWGDTYFYTYVDQALDITHIPSGVYRLIFHVNPDNRFEEINTENNMSKITFAYNKDLGTIIVLDQEPNSVPVVEHVYREQVL